MGVTSVELGMRDESDLLGVRGDSAEVKALDVPD